MSEATTKVLFVCTGNTCRSPMAAALMQQLLRERGVGDVVVDSAGVAAVRGGRVSSEAEAALAQLGLKPLRIRSQGLGRKLVDSSDLVVTMTDAHRDAVAGQYQQARGKTLTLLSLVDDRGGVPDPIGGTVARYRDCLERMRPALEALADRLAR